MSNINFLEVLQKLRYIERKYEELLTELNSFDVEHQQRDSIFANIRERLRTLEVKLDHSLRREMLRKR